MITSQIKQVQDNLQATLDKFNQTCDRFQERLDNISTQTLRQELDAIKPPSVQRDIKIEEFNTMKVILVGYRVIGSYQPTQKGWLAADEDNLEQYFDSATEAIGYILRSHGISSHIGAI